MPRWESGGWLQAQVLSTVRLGVAAYLAALLACGLATAAKEGTGSADALIATAKSLLEQEPERSAETAAEAVHQATSPIQRAQALHLHALASERLGQRTKTVDLLVEALSTLRTAVASEASLPPSEASQLLSQITAALHNHNQHRQSLAASKLGLSIRRDNNLPTAATLAMSALQHYLLAELDSSLEMAVAASARARAEDDDMSAACAAMYTGYVHRDLKSYPAALEDFQTAAAIAERIDNEPHRLRAVNEQGNVLQLLGKTDEALACKSEALAGARAIGDDALVMACSHDLAALLDSVGDPSGAREALLDALAVARDLGLARETTIAANNLANICVELGHFAEALDHASLALEVAEQAELTAQTLEAAVTLSRLFELSEQHEQALAMMRRAFELREQVFAEDRASQLAAAQASYESQKQADQIKLLERDREIQRLALGREKAVRKGWTAGFILAVVFAGGLALAMRTTNRARRALAVANAGLVRAQTELERQANTDPLTGLANRRDMTERIRLEQLRMERSGRPFAFILADLDGFKQINDEHGHSCGDTVLVEVSKRAQEAVRQLDVVARWGGEELLVLLPETGAEGARHVAERIWLAIRSRPIRCDVATIQVTATLGIATCNDGHDPEQAIATADEALYRGKQSGKDRIVMA